MDGFVRSVGATEPMGYYTPDVLPFAYSLASTFTVANRWFCSVPGPTYPNRRFLLAGTAFGGIATAPRALLDASAAQRHDLRPAEPGSDQLAQLLHGLPAHVRDPVDR